ncbi:MAG: tRNA (guanosine(37)-N1)-methyltransferase TrmD [Eubacteriales bacterium]|nr:tRNA (guanosine(37)-N1)-methyltransferase TrmD [Eubacteriales bacterium]
MNFHILSLFPEMIEGTMSHSMIGRAQERGLLNINNINIRDYSTNKHKRVDDYPYGGGNGMLMGPQAVYDAFASIRPSLAPDTPVIFMTPRGRVFRQEIARELATHEDVVLLCGHYEGIDERVLELICTDYISVGDYVLTGGELPAMIVVDAVSRLIPNVLSNADSARDESFEDGLLEHPQYTRPPEFMGKRVPDILLSGHHANITAWRRAASERETRARRPDLWAAYLAGRAQEE